MKRLTIKLNVGSGGFETFLRPGEAVRLRRVNRHGTSTETVGRRFPS